MLNGAGYMPIKAQIGMRSTQRQIKLGKISQDPTMFSSNCKQGETEV